VRWHRYRVFGKPMETLKEFWANNAAELICKLIGHKKPPQKKFGGLLLCPRCYHSVGRW
jgi:hypothetical protein